jgi:hypothetical protein
MALGAQAIGAKAIGGFSPGVGSPSLLTTRSKGLHCLTIRCHTFV